MTRHWRDNPGLELVLWAHSPRGPLRLVFPRQRAICFVGRDTRLDPVGMRGATRKPLNLKGLDGAEVDCLYFQRQRDLQQVRQHATRNSIRLYESDVKSHDRFLMERFIAAPFKAQGNPIQKNGYLELVNPRLRPASFEPQLTYVSLDIETDGIDGPILSVALSNQEQEIILMQGRAEDWTSELPIRWYPDEHALLEGFFEVFRSLDPDLILGWNLINFDLDCIERRCRRYRLPFAFGRGPENATILQPQQSGQTRIASIPGRVALDGIDNLRAAFWNFESFELGFVSHQLLGRKKLIDDPENKI